MLECGADILHLMRPLTGHGATPVAEHLFGDRDALYRPSFCSGSPRTERRFESAKEILPLGGRQPDRRTKPRVTPWRHLAASQRVRRFHRLVLPAVPLGKVHHPSPLLHIALDEPRDRGDVGEPRPDCLVAVAVEAHAAREPPCPLTVPGGLDPDRGVRVVCPIGQGLNHAEQGKGKQEK